MPTRTIQDVLDRQAEELRRLEKGEARTVLRALTDAERDILDRLERIEGTVLDGGFTQQHLRIMLAQVRDGQRRLEQRLNVTIAPLVREQQEMAFGHLLAAITAAEPEFRIASVGAQMETRVMQLLAQDQALLLHRYSTRNYTASVIDGIQRQLVTGMARGASFRDLRQGVRDVFAGKKSRAELIVRMELNAAYNRGHQIALVETATQTAMKDGADPLLKRADEYRDVRNHPMSRALHGTLALPSDPFRVPVAEVRKAAQQLNAERSGRGLAPRGVSGILWRRNGPVYEGTYPAHYNERGRQVPWRASWEEERPTAVQVPALAGATRHPIDNYPERVGPLKRGMTLRQAENAIRKQPIEYAVAYADDGRELGRFRGRKSSVSIPRRIHADLRDGVLTHNHPSSSPLSPPDMGLAAHLNLSEVRATRRNGETWRAERPPNGWPRAAVLEQAVRKIFRDASREANRKLRAKVKSGAIASHDTKRQDEELVRLYTRSIVRRWKADIEPRFDIRLEKVRGGP